jgi:hypothetical protein
MPPKKQAQPEIFSKDDLMKLIASNMEKPKKPRKKRDISEEQKEKLIERLAMMREKSAQIRKEKAQLKQKDGIFTRPSNESTMETPKYSREHANARVSELNPREGLKLSIEPDNDLFEKKYNSKFEKLEDSISKLDSSINEIKQMKMEKKLLREAKEKEAMEIKEKVKDEIKPKENTREQINPVITEQSNIIPRQSFKSLFNKKRY